MPYNDHGSIGLHAPSVKPNQVANRRTFTAGKPMTPRLQRIAADWKTYVTLLAGVGATLTAFEETFNRFKHTFTWFRDLPAEVRWVAVAVLGFVASTALIAVLKKRSILLRPDRFILSADDPRCLTGREQDTKDLAAECVKNTLVFLTGESRGGQERALTSRFAAF